MSTTATYITEAGKKATGTVADGGVSYTDALAANNAQLNSGLAEAAAQQPQTKTAEYYDTMGGLYSRMYDEAVAANNAALENARQRAQEATQAQIQSLNAGYQGTNRQLYRDYMNNQRTLPQQMAARGYNGGLSESSRLRLANSYQDALNANEQARLGQQAGYNQQLAQQMYEQQAAADQANQQALQQKLTYSAQLEQARKEQEYQELQDRAAANAAAGDYSEYLNLGYTQEEVDALTRMWLKQNKKLVNTWIKAHPEEAKRLGIKKIKKSSSSTPVYSSGKKGGNTVGTLINGGKPSGTNPISAVGGQGAGGGGARSVMITR